MNNAHKVSGRQQFKDQVRRWQDAGLEIVFTNGCFDILHRGHIDYLEKARALGDRLVIAVNSDASTRRLKGENRPINAEDDRAFLLASLSCVDLVTIFEEDTPLELITLVTPDILVKGGDYTPDQVVGREVVESCGGRVAIIPFRVGFSTTLIEEKIRSQNTAG